MKQLLYLITIAVSLACHQAAPDKNQVELIPSTTAPTAAIQDTEATIAVPADSHINIIDTKVQEKKVQPARDVVKVKPKSSKVDTKRKVISISPSSTDDAVISRRIDPVDKQATVPTIEQIPIIEQIPDKKEEIVPFKPKANTELHQSFHELLQKYVSKRGEVDYAGIQREEHVLADYLTVLSTIEANALNGRASKMAYWINLYNAATIQLILKNHPVKKVTDLDGGKPWDVKRVKTKRGLLSLNDIENGIIRTEFKDPRIHFAVNCAAKSCPPLANQAYTEDNLDALMIKQAKAFVNNRSFNEIGESAVNLSKIFEWYADDFTKNIIDYINVYSEIQAKQDAQITYKEYDWSLNGK